MAGETLGIDGGRGDDHFQVGPLGQQLLEVAEEKINVQAAFVRFIDDDGVVLTQQRIGLGFSQQDTVGHQLDPGTLAQGVVEAHLEADMLARCRTQLLGDALGS